MNKEAIQFFTARITQASKSELVVILYEMTLTKIEEAERSYRENNLSYFDKELK